MIFARPSRSGRVCAVSVTLHTTALALLLTASAPPPLPEPVVVDATTSHYVVLGTDAGQRGHRTGCRDGRSGASGPRVLFFGTQEGEDQLRPPGTTASSAARRVPTTRAGEFAREWVRGFLACRTGDVTATVALAVNNKADGGVDARAAGLDWARLVERVGAAVGPGPVRVAGGLDAEPSWSGPEWARDWLAGYLSGTDRALIAANSADGCPTEGSGAAQAAGCNNGWTQADVFHLATGGGPQVAALPQIYRTDGVQARQWAQISQWGMRNGKGPLRVLGALSQQRACEQKGGCQGIDNSPAEAREQLAEALADVGATAPTAPLTVSDVAWPEDDERGRMVQ